MSSSSTAVSNHSAVTTAKERVSYRERLIRFYRRYDPSKLHHVDYFLNRFQNQEENMFAALLKKYGPEPPSTGTVSVVPCRERLRLRLYHFYQFYNPEKLGMLDELADGYWEDGEEDLLRALVDRYGPEPMTLLDGTLRNAPRRHRGLAIKDEERRASVVPVAPSSATISASAPRSDGTRKAELLQTALEAPTNPRPSHRNDDDDDIDQLMLRHNSDEDLLELELKQPSASTGSSSQPHHAKQSGSVIDDDLI